MSSKSEAFLQQIEAFLTRSGMSPTAFGKAVLNDPNFVTDLRRGRKPNLDLVEHTLSFMSQYDHAAIFE